MSSLSEAMHEARRQAELQAREAERGRRELDRMLLLAMTGYGQEEDRRRSREAGFDHHLIKPVDLDKLRELVDSWSRA